MNQIEQLKQDIQSIEDEAGQLDPKDYEELYKLLAVAYFKAKDIIELYHDANPVIEAPVEDTSYAYEVKIAALESTVQNYESKLDNIRSAASTLVRDATAVLQESTEE